ncbi:Lycopene cyclase protein [Musa troglodytarum]|uniref:Lycopene cyclase protein n=1 Tax=Musa troglodytarum TaxID=320322 RepID=A0A9E7FUU9_9LILI|nr:Lycopene cyclase protein [Musa troglodytarum]
MVSRAATHSPMEKEQQHEVAIVGAGIAGLATAVGLPSLVLEKSPELRSTGAALTLFPNAWRALEALGVAHKLTPLYHAIERSRVTDLSSGTTREVPFSRTNRGDTGIRSVHRKALLEALAEELEPGTIRFSSKITSIDQEGSSPLTALHLDDGSVIKAKVVIGCDGVHSVVARWLGLAEAIDSGRSAIRGLAVFPEGHELITNEALQYLGDGKRAGLVPLNKKDMAAEAELTLIEVTENLAKDFPSEVQTAVRHLDLATVSWAPLLFRAPWNLLLGRIHRGCVAVSGDAMHPMTPEIGQGGCAALEDAVVLARSLARARSPDQLAAGVEGYTRERRWRSAGVVAAAYLSGWVQQGGNAGVWRWAVKWFRRRIYYRFIHPRIMEAIRGYDCGDLPPAE